MKIEAFNASCSLCAKTVALIMHRSETAAKAGQLGVQSVPAVVIDGKLAGCRTGLDDYVLRSALAA